LFDLNKNNNKKFGATLFPGDYLILANLNEYFELNEYLKATKGECLADFTLEPKIERKLIVNAINVFTGKPVEGTLFKVNIYY